MNDRNHGQHKKYPLATFTAAVMGTPYALGSKTGDCFSLVVSYLDFRDIPIPDAFEGVTLETYADLYAADPAGAKEAMVRFISQTLTEIPVHKAFAGDILLLQLKDSEALPFLAIHGGQSSIIAASPECGVMPWAIDHYIVRRAWTCRQQSQQ